MISNKIKERLSKRYENTLWNYRATFYINSNHTLYSKGEHCKFKTIHRYHLNKVKTAWYYYLKGCDKND